jgi:DNA repair protein RecO (recombination protein O)
VSDQAERRQRLYRSEAIVLKRRDYGEADRLLTVFTPNHGKLVLLGKGVRKTHSRKAGHVELFTLSTLLIAKARTWDLVTQAETIETYLPLRGSLLRTSYAYYVAELLDGFTQEQGRASGDVAAAAGKLWRGWRHPRRRRWPWRPASTICAC